MKITLDSIFNIDRRYVFVAVFLALLIPLLVPYEMPCKPARDAKAMFNEIDRVAAKKGVVFMSLEFAPEGAPELEPMARATLSHLFARGGKAVIISKGSGQEGVTLHEKLIAECVQQFGAEYEKDYVYLGFKPGATSLVINLGQSLHSAFPTDARGKLLSDIPLTSNIARFKDFDYAIAFVGSLTMLADWITYGQSPYDMNMGFGVMANVTAESFNYINSGQINGLLGGLAGAAQYEQMLVDSGIGLIRRFSAADLIRSKLPGFCAKLTAGDRPPILGFVWKNLSAEVQEAVQKTANEKMDKLTQDDKQALAEALNMVTDQPGVISDQDLAGVPVSDRLQKLLDDGAVSSKKPRILRRLYLENLFPEALAKADAGGQAMRWMTPQSIAHVALILAILFGNVCYFWERKRAKKQAQV